MAMEKRSGVDFDVRDTRELIKYASDEGRIVILNMDGFLKQADGRKDRKAVIIIATGDNAEKLREAFQPLLEE